MEIIDIVKKLGKYKKVGIEYKIENCPFCNENHKKDKFYVNSVTGAIYCHMSDCEANKGGTIQKLADKLGITDKINSTDKSNLRKTVKQEIKEIDVNYDHVELLGNKEIAYFENRGISQETLKKARVLKSAKTGDLLFFLTAGQDTKNKAKIVGVKTRSLEKNIKCVPGSQSFLLFWELIPKQHESIIITEGEIDALSLMESGIENVCSIPFGVSNIDWIDNQREWLETKKEVILWFDNDEAGRNGVEKAINRLKLIQGLKLH